MDYSISNFCYIKSRQSFVLCTLGPYYILRSIKRLITPFSVNFSKFFIKLFFVKSLRFSFSGKGYRVYLDLNSLSFTFGHSHLFYVYFFSSPVKLTAKTKGFLMGLNYFNLKTLNNKLFSAKPLNIFTWRGVRLKASWIPKKAGKISMYR